MRALGDQLAWLMREVRDLRERVVDPGDDVLTTKQAAALAGVTEKTIRRWVRNSRLVPLGGKPYRFRRSDVVKARDRKARTDNVVDFEKVNRRVDELVNKKGPKK